MGLQEGQKGQLKDKNAFDCEKILVLNHSFIIMAVIRLRFHFFPKNKNRKQSGKK